MKTIQVLTVCLGNICRSPAAQGILADVAERAGVPMALDSAGTAAYHVGNKPDARSIKALLNVGLDIRHQRARQVAKEDFAQYDWILAMDEQNRRNLLQLCPPQFRDKVVLFGEAVPGLHLGEVDDPYYGSDDGFAHMVTHLTELSEAFVEYLRTHKPR